MSNMAIYQSKATQLWSCSCKVCWPCVTKAGFATRDEAKVWWESHKLEHFPTLTQLGLVPTEANTSGKRYISRSINFSSRSRRTNRRKAEER